MIANVSGKVMVNTEPAPALVCTLTEPPSSLTLRRTTSIPTPRPDRSVVASAVENPGWNISSATWSSVKRSEEHTSELQSLMRISYAVLCLKKNKTIRYDAYNYHTTIN